ncbi:MAG: response regulator [candidate division Zixibacteria bacterium]|nr:response regulator [candidate division Zixibacteria bacterium]
MLQLTDRAMNLMHVEDNDDHAEIVHDAAGESLLINTITRFKDGESAFEYLRSQSDIESPMMLPDIILLDLLLPNMDGMEFLKNIKSDNRLNNIPVVVLSSCMGKKSIREAYSNGAAGYITKPGDYNQFLIKLAEFSSYWALTSEIPSASID